jgi:hypothetical protein
MITIYWGANTCYSPEAIRAEAPIPILQKLFYERIPKDLAGEVQYNRCPALVDELMNVYGIKPFWDYVIQFNQRGLSSPDYDQEFLNRNVQVKSFKGNLYELNQFFSFFTDEPSLEMSVLPAYLEDNNVANNTIVLPAKIDIGKYFRGLSFGFHTKKNCNEISFNRKEICYYIKFHTKKKLKFKQFLWTPELNHLGELMMAAKKNKYDFMDLNYYYNIFDRFNFKKKMIKIIKENLCKKVT